MKSLSSIWKFAFGKEPEPPAPYEIALTLAAALLASGRFADDAGGAMDTAWTLVIPFYQGQVAYGRQVRTLFDVSRHASAPEGDMSPAEARAYVAGEAGIGPPLATRTVQAPPNADPAYWERVNAAALAVRQARSALDVATASGEEDRIVEARQAFDEAAAAQSAVYL